MQQSTKEPSPLKFVVGEIDKLVEDKELGFNRKDSYTEGYVDGRDILAAQLKAHFTNLDKQGYYNVT